jgi:hypothetical protein
MRSIPCFLLASAVCLVTACASTDSATTDDEAEGDGQAVSTGGQVILQAKLYDAPGTTVNPSCDLFRLLKITRERRGQNQKVWATLETKLEGSCLLAIAPDPQRYELTVIIPDICNTTAYIAGDGFNLTNSKLTIKDNRERRCDAITDEDEKGTIVAIEASNDASAVRWYSEKASP